MCGDKMAGKTLCNICGLSHHPGGCKQKSETKRPRSNNIDALNILSVTNSDK